MGTRATGPARPCPKAPTPTAPVEAAQHEPKPVRVAEQPGDVARAAAASAGIDLRCRNTCSRFVADAALSSADTGGASGVVASTLAGEGTMALVVKRVGGDGVQVENGAGNWMLFTLDELRSHATLVRADMVSGDPALPEREADLFAWAAFAAARGYAAEHGLIAGT